MFSGWKCEICKSSAQWKPISASATATHYASMHAVLAASNNSARQIHLPYMEYKWLALSTNISSALKYPRALITYAHLANRCANDSAELIIYARYGEKVFINYCRSSVRDQEGHTPVGDSCGENCVNIQCSLCSRQINNANYMQQQQMMETLNIL